MDTTKRTFYIDGDEKAGQLPIALDRAIDELAISHNLTLTVSDVIIDRNPHGNGMWAYTVKVTKHEAN